MYASSLCHRQYNCLHRSDLVSGAVSNPEMILSVKEDVHRLCKNSSKGREHSQYIGGWEPSSFQESCHVVRLMR